MSSTADEESRWELPAGERLGLISFCKECESGLVEAEAKYSETRGPKKTFERTLTKRQVSERKCWQCGHCHVAAQCSRRFSGEGKGQDEHATIS